MVKQKPKVSPVWRILFLGLTGLVLGLEVWASADEDLSTEPWTQLIVNNVDAELAFTGIGAVTVWLFLHFGIRYFEKYKGKNRYAV